MTFIMRPKEESPIYRRMLKDAVESGDPEKMERARAYGEKVDAFLATGEATMLRLEYEGPDLSPGADRPNCMKGSIKRGFDSNGERRGFGTPPAEDAGGLRGRTTVSPLSWRGNDRQAMDNT